MRCSWLVTIGRVSDDYEVSAPSDSLNRALDVLAQPVSRPLGWLWARGFRFLMVIDVVVLFSTMTMINVVRFGANWPTYPMSHYWVGFAISTGIHLAVNYFSGLYEREPRLGSRPWLPRVSIAMGISVAFDGLAAVLFDRYLMPRLNLGVLLVVGSLLLTGTRQISRTLSRRRRGPSRVVLVGSAIESNRARPYLGAATGAAIVAGEAESMDDVLCLVQQAQASDVLLLDLEAFTTGFPEPLTSLHLLGVGVHQRVSAAETLLGLSAVREVGGIPFTRLRLHALAPHQLRLKRIFDLTLVMATTPIWLPVVALLALYSRVAAGPGVMFRQPRVGQFGKHFTIVKFRTMVHNAESLSGPVLAAANDARVVPVLRWLRTSRLDELPQLFNVVRGSMSLVGPRPERPEFVEQLRSQIPGYDRRHQLPPGITGLAQTRGRYDTDAAHKLGYDLQYIVNWSLIFDIEIVASTVSRFISTERSAPQ